MTTNLLFLFFPSVGLIDNYAGVEGPKQTPPCVCRRRNKLKRKHFGWALQNKFGVSGRKREGSSVNERASSFAACQSLCLATKASRPPFDESYTTQQNSLLAPRTHKESCHPPQTDRLAYI